MRQNVFLGDGPFGSQMASVLGQYSYPMQRPGNVGPSRSLPPSPLPARRLSPQYIPQYSWNQSPRLRATPAQAFTRPTGQPTAAGSSDVHCYYCEGLPEFPTYWMSEAQAEQWNKDRDSRCVKVNESECQKKYGQAQANLRYSGFNAFNLPGSTTYASTMSGRIPVQNPELIG